MTGHGWREEGVKEKGVLLFRHRCKEWLNFGFCIDCKVICTSPASDSLQPLLHACIVHIRLTNWSGAIPSVRQKGVLLFHHHFKVDSV